MTPRQAALEMRERALAILHDAPISVNGVQEFIIKIRALPLPEEPAHPAPDVDVMALLEEYDLRYEALRSAERDRSDEWLAAILKRDEARAALVSAITNLQSQLSAPTSIKEILDVSVDPGDWTVRPSLQYVLMRGFNAMGWLQTVKSSEDMAAAISAALAARGRK